MTVIDRFVAYVGGGLSVDRNRWRVAVALVLLLAFLYRLVLIAELPGTYNGERGRQDGYLYDSLAQNMLAGYGYAVNRNSILTFGDCPPCQRVTYPLPGYATFLASVYRVFGHNYLAVKLLQALLDVFTTFVAYLIAWRISQSRIIAFVTLVLAAVWPFTAIWVADLQTETVATFLATLLVYTGLRAARPGAQAWVIAMGMTAAAAIYVRVGFLFLPAAVLPVIWLSRSLDVRSRIWRTVVVLMITYGLLVPWAVRNYGVVGRLVLFGKQSLSPELEHHRGYSAWYRNWLSSPTYTSRVVWDYAIYPNTIPASPFPDWAYDSDQERAEVEALVARVASGEGFSAEIDARFAAIAREKAARHPWRRYVLLPLERMARSWINSGTSGINSGAVKGPFSLARIRREPIGFVVRMILGTLHSSSLFLAALGARLLRSRWRLAVAAMLPVLYHTLIAEAVGVGVQPRYVIYGMPVMLVFVAVSLVAIWDRIRLLRHVSSSPGL